EFDDEKGVFNFAGKIGFGPGNWSTASGIGWAQIDTMHVEVNALIGLHLNALTPLLPELAEKIVSTNLAEQNDEPAEGKVERLFAKLVALSGAEATKIYTDKLGAVDKPLGDAWPRLNPPLIMSNVNLRGSEQY